jgi:hypothetical protein
MDLADLIEELLAPLKASAKGAVAVAQLQQALTDCLLASDELQINWQLQLAPILPRIVQMLVMPNG